MSESSSNPAIGHDFTVLARYVIEKALGEKWIGRKADPLRGSPHGNREEFSVESQRAVTRALLQRNSIGVIVRLTGVPKHRIKFLIRTPGEACSSFSAHNVPKGQSRLPRTPPGIPIARKGQKENDS